MWRVNCRGAHPGAGPGYINGGPFPQLERLISSDQVHCPSSNMAATALASQPAGAAAVQPCRRSATARPFQPRAGRRAHLHVACQAAQEPPVLAVTRRTAAAALAALPALLLTPAGTAAACSVPRPWQPRAVHVPVAGILAVMPALQAVISWPNAPAADAQRLMTCCSDAALCAVASKPEEYRCLCACASVAEKAKVYGHGHSLHRVRPAPGPRRGCLLCLGAPG